MVRDILDILDSKVTRCATSAATQRGEE